MFQDIWNSLTGYCDSSGYIDLLDSNQLFQGLSSDQLCQISDLLYRREYDNGEVICSSGDPATALYLIEEGGVEVVIEESTQEKKRLAELSAGDFFGERALCKDLTRTATARSTDHTVLYVLFRQELMELVHRERDLGIKLLSNLVEVLGDRLQSANNKIQNLMLNPDSDEAGSPDVS